MSLIIKRPRRLRSTHNMRALVQEGHLGLDDLLAPLFLKEGKGLREPIGAMPGQFRFSLDELLKEIRELAALGIKAVALFPALEEKDKDPMAKEALNPLGLYPNALRAIKEQFPELVVMTDVALDPYSSDGHDGLVDPQTGRILNDETLEILSQMAVLHADCGADLIGPSDMMDGRVGAIRMALDGQGHQGCGIISYTAKYASSFYGPFREALDSAPRAGDKKTYQMNFANAKEALREAALDEEEGADILMVKPGLAYLDIVNQLSRQTTLPIAAYQVSGEYSMIKAAGERGWIDPKGAMIESLTAFKRAGASVILTYFAKEMAYMLNGH